MKKISKLLCLILAICMLVSVTACSNGKDTGSSSEPTDLNSTVSNDPVSSTDSTVSTDSTDSTDSKSEPTKTSSSSSKAESTSSSSKVPASGSWQNVLKNMPSKLRGTQVEVFHWNPVSELPGGAKVLTKFQQQTGIKINWKVASYDNYDVELQARVAAGKSPDLVLFQWMNANRLKLCQPISKVDFDFDNSDWDKEVLKYYTVNKKTYAVNMEGTYLNRPQGIYYNKSLIEKYDYEDPYILWKKGKWTEDKFMEMCEDFKRKVNGPAWVVSKYDVWPLLLGLQCEISFKDGKYGNNLTNKKAITAWQKGAELFHSGLIDRTWDMNGFEAGKYLFMDSSIMYSRTTQPYFSTLKSTGTLGIVPFFEIKGQSKQYQLMSEYEAYGFAKGSKNTTGAAYFLRYYLDPASYDSKTFFMSEQAKEVYEYCMKRPNRIMHNRYPLGSGNSTSPIAEVRVALQEATSAQVPTVLNTYVGAVDACVKDLNARLKALS